MSTKRRIMKATPTLILLEDISTRLFQLLGEVFYKAIYDLQHKASETDFRTNCNTARQKHFSEISFW